jgi:hypothetical protein
MDTSVLDPSPKRTTFTKLNEVLEIDTSLLSKAFANCNAMVLLSYLRPRLRALVM